MVGKSHPTHSRLNLVGSNLMRLIFLFGLLTLLLAGFRLAGFISLYFNDSLNIATDMIGRSLFMGFRYDAKVVVILLLPLVVLSFISAVFPNNTFQKFFKRLYIGYGAVIIIMFLFIETINYNYFQFFKSQLNVEVYGIFYDDTSALLSSIYTNYPVFSIIIAVVALFLLLIFTLSKIVEIEIKKLGEKFYTVVIILILPLIALAARGSFTTFPLQIADRAVSSNPYVNEFVMNGAYALMEAYKDLTRGKFYTEIDKILSQEGFATLDECIEAYPFPLGKIESDSLFYYTSSLKPNDFEKPNVVLFFMEGMGTVFIRPNDELTPENMGEMYHQLVDCDLFLNAMPGGNITHSSLENFVLSTMDGPLSQSRYSSRHIPSSIATTFKNAGYSTTFITGGKLNWRNYGTFLRLQGFDNCEGLEKIKVEQPHAE